MSSEWSCVRLITVYHCLGYLQIGQALIDDGHYASREVKTILYKLNEEWAELAERAFDKGEKLRQAAQQELFNKALEDAEAKLAEMERLISSQDIGKDLRGVRDLLKKHQVRSLIARVPPPHAKRNTCWVWFIHGL